MPSHMSLDAGIPADTYQAARQVYHLPNIYLQIGDDFEAIFTKINLCMLNPWRRTGCEMVSRLSLTTALQFAERLPDPVAHDASKQRIDWKYALHLPYHHQGIAEHSLCKFRQNLYASPAAQGEFDLVLQRLQQVGLFQNIQGEQPDTRKVLVTICKITRLQALYAGMKDALGSLVAHSPDWLIEHMPPYWYRRYKTGSLGQMKARNEAEIELEAQHLGNDIYLLMRALDEQPPTIPSVLIDIQPLISLFTHQFDLTNDQITWRQPLCHHCSQMSLENK